MNAGLHSRKTSAAAGVSVAALLWLCVIILIAALGFVSFSWMKSNSRQAKLQEDLDRSNDVTAKAAAEARALAAQASNMLAQIEISRASNAVYISEVEKKGRIATAQAARTRFAARAQETTNRLHAVLERIPLVSKELQDFSTGESGKPLSPYPELVQRAGAFIATGPKIPSTQTAIAHIENLRRYLNENTEHFNTEVVPAAAAEIDLEQARDWANKSDSDMDSIRSSIKGLLTDVSYKKDLGDKKPLIPLQAALLELKQKLDQIDFDKKVAATNTAINIRTTAETNAVITAAQRDADKIARELARLQSQEEERRKKQLLIDEAQSPSIQMLLAPFITPGVRDLNGPLTEKGPHSLSQLLGQIRNPNPHDRIMRVASDNDPFRPRWKRVNVRNNPAAWEEADRVIKALERLGPVLVELGMLRP